MDFQAKNWLRNPAQPLRRLRNGCAASATAAQLPRRLRSLRNGCAWPQSARAVCATDFLAAQAILSLRRRGAGRRSRLQSRAGAREVCPIVAVLRPEGAQACSRGQSEAAPPEWARPWFQAPTGAAAVPLPSRLKAAAAPCILDS